MASQTLRPHRSPSPGPAPSTPTMPGQPAKLTRQSLGPPTAASGAPKGFGNLGISSPTTSQPRHASSGVMPGNHRESLGARPSLGSGNRGASGGRPSSEFLPGARDARSRTPETEQIDQWFKHLANWEQTLEEMAAASTDQNFTEELGAIEQWFRVLSEAERTAALYSLLQHSTPVQIRFFSSVLQHMSQSDPLTAMLSPNPNNSQSGLASQMDKLSTFKSPSAGGGNGYTGSPSSSYLDDPAKVRARQNRISAPGTLQPTVDRWHGQQLDQVLERGNSPDNVSSRSRSPGGDLRPKSENYGARPNETRSPRQSGVGLGLDAPISPLLNNPSWASMVNTPLAPAFNDSHIAPQTNLTSALNMANLQLAASKIAFEDARKYRRPTGQTPSSSRNVSGQSEDTYSTPHARGDARGASPHLNNYGAYPRSPVLDQFGLGLGDNSALAGLGMNFANLGINPMNANAAQMLAIAQAQQQINNSNAALASANYGQNGYNSNRSARPSAPGRRSPMPNNVRSSPTPQAQGAANTGGGAGGGAGVAGPDDVDPKTVEDVGQWLRVLRLHKYTTTFEKYKWQDMVAMNDQDLQDKGVAAQGARTKFLKVFHNVRTHLGMPHPPGQEEYAATKET